MSRVPKVKPEELSDEQRRIAAEIAGARGGVLGGPFAIWLRIPEIAERVNHLSDRLRTHSKLDRRLFELLVLVVTRDWKADYAWKAHARHALEAGLAPGVVEAIGAGAAPAFERDDERLVYDIFTELATARTLGRATYERGLSAFGLDLMIEMVTTAGLYTMYSMVLSSFDVPA